MPLAPPARALAAPTLPRTAVLRRCACGGRAPEGGECEECRARRMGLRRSATSAAAPGFAPPLVHEVLRSPGRPLDAGTRAWMEPRFGHSFADVRVHADGRAAESAEAVSARAYTVGRDLVFGAGRYAPGSDEGRGLIAHELAHVVQQSADAGPMAWLEVGSVDAPEERQAEVAAGRVMAGGAAELSAAPGWRVARWPLGGSTEDLHHDIAEQRRRQLGLPPGGVNEHGERVGPTDFELVHNPGAYDMREPCPPPDDLRALMCLGVSRSDEQVTCRFTPAHRRILDELTGQALVQVQGASRRLAQASGASRRLIMRQARRSFAGSPPSWERIQTVVSAMERILGGSELRFEGGACGDYTCYSPIVAAYVNEPGQLPIYVCMHAFNPARRAVLMKTIIHEVAHVAGVAAATPAEEDYCENAGCDEECRGPEHADAWMHFIDCIGGPMYTPRTDFTDRLIRDVEGL